MDINIHCWNLELPLGCLTFKLICPYHNIDTKLEHSESVIKTNSRLLKSNAFIYNWREAPPRLAIIFQWIISKQHCFASLRAWFFNAGLFQNLTVNTGPSFLNSTTICFLSS